MCECDRPDEVENPHRHIKDAVCVFWNHYRAEIFELKRKADLWDENNDDSLYKEAHV